jgi:arylsulfatase B
VGKDLGQNNDVAGDNPEIMARLRAGYEEWWNSLEDVHGRKTEIIIGHPAENPSRLTCHDWYSDENVANVDLTWHHQLYPAWNQAMVRSGARFSGGYWAVHAEQEGEYEFEVRRWPREVDQPLRASLAPGPPGPGEPVFREMRGEAIDIRTVVLRINGQPMREEVQSDRLSHGTFKARLRQGLHRLEAAFVDGTGREFGAYYLYVTRLQPTNTNKE